MYAVVPTTNIDYTSALTSTIQVTKTVSAINSHSTAYFTNSDQELPPMYGSFSVSTTLGKYTCILAPMGTHIFN